MELDRGTLARIDRKLLAGFGQGEAFQMVRVPVTAAKWSTWKRYCDAAGISMGRAILALIDRELVSVFDEPTGEAVPLLPPRAEEQAAAREAQLIDRVGELKVSEERVQRQNERLRHWEEGLEARQQRADLAARLSARPTATGPTIGRNQRCPCGSGLKYKVCHGG